MHNNWLLGECIKFEQYYDCQWFNCARAATVGNQVCFNLIIMRYPRIARAVVNIQMFIYLYWGGQCDGRYSGKTPACVLVTETQLDGPMDLAVEVSTPYTDLFFWIFTRPHGFDHVLVTFSLGVFSHASA